MENIRRRRTPTPISARSASPRRVVRMLCQELKSILRRNPPHDVTRNAARRPDL
jgi:hypothetical protein